MSDIYNPDPGFAVADLGQALRELLATFTSAPEHDSDGGEYSSWWLMLRPADDDQDDVPPTATAPTVTVSVDAESTRIEVTRPVADEVYRLDDGAAGVLIEGSPYAVELPAGIVRILTRLVMDVRYTEEHSASARGVCQLCGQGRALSIWRPR